MPRGDIDQALREADIDWGEQLREVWRRKFNRQPQDARERAQQGRFLAYRGYSMEMISRLLRGNTDD
ncbi:recombination regulator RecX [compost metagenome]